MNDPFKGSQINKNYKIGNFIAKGGFASVYRARELNTGLEVAIKVIDKQSERCKDNKERVFEEIRIHTELNHPSILKLYQTHQDQRYFYLILELCHNGEMHKYLEKNNVFSEDEARRIMQQIVNGVLYLHKNKIIHRDLTAKNLLLTKNNDVKIADFGLATQLSQPDEKHLTMCGTPNYIAPEIASKSSHGLEADVWSLGCLFYLMVVGRPPFYTSDAQRTLNRVVAGKFIIPSYLSFEATDLIKRLLCKNPSDRLELRDILNHPFMTKSSSNEKTNDKLSKLSNGASDSGMGTMSTNASHNSRPISNRLPILDECGNSVDYVNTKSSRGKKSVQRCGGLPLLKSKNEIFKWPEDHTSCSQKLEKNEKYQTDENTCPCSKSQCEHTKPTNSCCFSTDSGHRDWSESLKNNHRSNCCSHLSPCYDAKQCSHTDGCGCRKITEKKEGATSNQNIESRIPLDTKRLKPVKHQTSTYRFSILDTGEVCVESLKKRNGEEKIICWCRISADGQKMIVGDKKKKIPDVYSFNEIPSTLWIKYSLAQRFVNIVKAKTAKITFYSSQAKCALMENSPNANFEVKFYNGAKVLKLAQGTEICENNASSYKVESVGGIENLSQNARKLWDHFYLCHQKCLRIEKVLLDEDEKHNESTFPLIVGIRPALATISSQVQSPEAPCFGQQSSCGSTVNHRERCRSPCPSINSRRTPSPYPSVELSETDRLKYERPCKKMEIAGVGTGYVLSNDRFIFKYVDGTSIAGCRTSNIVIYTDKDGGKKKIGPNDSLPKDLRKKITYISIFCNQSFPRKKCPSR